jgi:hypothetical protein
MSKWTIRTCAVTLTAVAMVTVAGAPASALPISENTHKKGVSGRKRHLPH